MAVEAATQNSLFQTRGTAGTEARETLHSSLSDIRWQSKRPRKTVSFKIEELQESVREARETLLAQQLVGYQMAVEAATQNSLFQNRGTAGICPRSTRNLAQKFVGYQIAVEAVSLSKSPTARFQASPHDPCLFHNDKTVLIVYVDDVLIYGKDRNDIQALVDSLNKDFALSDAGEDVHSYLGIKQAQPAQRHCRHIAAISHRATFEITQLFAERREPHATPRHAAADVKVSSNADEDGDDHSPDPTGWTYSMMSLTLDAQQLWNRTPSIGNASQIFSLSMIPSSIRIFIFKDTRERKRRRTRFCVLEHCVDTVYIFDLNTCSQAYCFCSTDHILSIDQLCTHLTSLGF